MTASTSELIAEPATKKAYPERARRQEENAGALGVPGPPRDAVRVSWFVVAVLVGYPYVAILVLRAYVERTTPTESWFDEQLRRLLGNGRAHPT